MTPGDEPVSRGRAPLRERPQIPFSLGDICYPHHVPFRGVETALPWGRRLQCIISNYTDICRQEIERVKLTIFRKMNNGYQMFALTAVNANPTADHAARIRCSVVAEMLKRAEIL